MNLRNYPYYDVEVPSAEMAYRGEDELVSIIMPTYNSSSFVAESIEAIIAQTYQLWELIVVDDCSSDNTLAILQHYAKEDSRVKVHVNEKNSGAGYTRNACLEKAKGRYIAFCDSDDMWMPEKLAIQLKFMQEKHVNICFAPYFTCDSAGEYLGYVPAPKHVNLFNTMCDDKIGFLTCIYDARTCGKHYMPLQRKRQDYAFVLNLLRTCPHAYSVQQPLARYRLHTNNISGHKYTLVKYNALTYHVVFGWSMTTCYAFLFTFFLPCYIWKRVKNKIINLFCSK